MLPPNMAGVAANAAAPPFSTSLLLAIDPVLLYHWTLMPVPVDRWRQALQRYIGRAHVLTLVTNAHLVCRLLLAKKTIKSNIISNILPLDRVLLSLVALMLLIST